MLLMFIYKSENKKCKFSKITVQLYDTHNEKPLPAPLNTHCVLMYASPPFQLYDLNFKFCINVFGW